MERENWGGALFLVFRRGQRKIFELEKWFCRENKITKKHYVNLSYGKKLVRKIFSEYKLSRRQRNYIQFIFNRENPLEVFVIDMQAFGLPKIKSLFYQENGEDPQKK